MHGRSRQIEYVIGMTVEEGATSFESHQYTVGVSHFLFSQLNRMAFSNANFVNCVRYARKPRCNLHNTDVCNINTESGPL